MSGDRQLHCYVSRSYILFLLFNCPFAVNHEILPRTAIVLSEKEMRLTEAWVIV